MSFPGSLTLKNVSVRMVIAEQTLRIPRIPDQYTRQPSSMQYFSHSPASVCLLGEESAAPPKKIGGYLNCTQPDALHFEKKPRGLSAEWRFGELGRVPDRRQGKCRNLSERSAEDGDDGVHESESTEKPSHQLSIHAWGGGR